MSIDDTRTRFIFPKPVDIRPLAGQVIVQTLPDATSCATSATDDRPVRDTLDQKDNGCLLTNVHRHTDEKVRLIGIQRGDIVNKKDIELLLYIKLGISPVIDSLDHISNFFWLDSSLHRAFDQYGLFAITVSKNTGLQLKKLLEDEFDDRQRIADEGGDVQPRLFYGFMSNIYNLEFVKKPELQVVALLPHQLLPHGFPLIRRRRGTTGDDSVYDTYTVADDGLLRSTGGEHEVFPIETQETTREGDEVLNVWFLLINAASKFQNHRRRYGLDHLPEDSKEIIDLTFELEELIYKQLEGRTAPGQAAEHGVRRSSRGAKRKRNEGDNSNDEETTRGEPGVSPAGGSGPRYSLAGFEAIEDTAERALYAAKWFGGYDKISAGQDELFGRQPTETAYSSNPDMMQQWAANVSKEESKEER